MTKKRMIWGWILITVGVVSSLRSGRTILQLIRAGAPLSQAQQELAVVEAENASLRTKMAEVESPSFAEREARNKLGYGKPGEVILVLPDEEAGKSGVVAEKKIEEANWQKWAILWLRLDSNQ